RKAVGADEGGGSQGLSGGPPSASLQSGEGNLHASGGGRRSDLRAAASNLRRAEPPGDRQRLRGDDQGPGGCAPDLPGLVIRNSTKTDRRTRGEGAAPRDSWGDVGVRGGRRSHGL